MNLTFQQEHKSIKRLPIAELPDFTVITGANGAGKTHFLEALSQGALQVGSIDAASIKYYSWQNMTPPDEQAVQPRQFEDARNATCQAIAKLCSAYESDMLKQLSGQGQRVDFVTGEILTGITKEQLLEAADSTDLVNNGSSTIVHTIVRAKNACVAALQAVRIQGMGYFQMSSTGAYEHLDLSQCVVFEQILARTTKPFFAITVDDCLRLYPLSSVRLDPFIGSLTNLFAGYVQARTKNATNKSLAEDYGAKAHFLSKEDFLTQYGQPPWEVFNQVLTAAKLTFRFEEPDNDPSVPLEVRLFHTSANVEVKFAGLSSGERVLISLANFLFFSQDSRQPTAMPELILLDEVDAPLHPSMTVDLLRTITDVMVGQYGRKVILATHSPSTVALAPEESIHVMDVETKTLRKATRDEGVRALTVGVPTLSINLANRRQAFVESLHDVGLYERIAAVAGPHLLPDVSLTFMAAGHERNGGCALLTSLVNQLKQAGNNAVFGIVDWDGERVSAGNLRVLGENVRHSIENYLFDPVLLGALLLREKALCTSPPLLQDRENYFNLREFDNARLQQVANAVVTSLEFPLTDMVQVSYANGRTVQVPQAYLFLRGHDLEEKIKTTFPVQLKRFHQEPKLKEEILHKILEDMPELLPADFVTLLTSIQGASAN